jgi:hypothetical protein
MFNLAENARGIFRRPRRMMLLGTPAKSVVAARALPAHFAGEKWASRKSFF